MRENEIIDELAQHLDVQVVPDASEDRGGGLWRLGPYWQSNCRRPTILGPLRWVRKGV